MASASATTSPDRLTARFEQLRGGGRRAFVPYITAGHPDREASLALMQGLADAGADAIEVGVPFSDPMADGPVIQGSSQRALAGGMSLGRTLELIAAARLEIPVVLFSYLNPLLAAGKGILDDAAAAGCSGVLLTDLPLGADPELEAWFGGGPLAYVRLVAPTTPVARMREIARHGRGFVYVISRLGVTGTRDTVSADLAPTVGRLRGVTTLPLCVGFGISRPEQAREVAAIADGVVVGSAIVKEADSSVDRAVALARSIRSAIDSH
ncbi:MAG TPA: tryptophan synthase subunit alpha [Gemmatimonadaceae bacterium]|nr:tryptophan synthase subunit alpha [Gemmatimonadaceae bacterium]